MEFKLIIKKLNNSLTQKEEVIFNDWYNSSSSHKEYFISVKNNYDNDASNMDIDIEKGWLAIQNNIQKNKIKNSYWKFTAAAASIIVLFSLNFIFNNNSDKNSVPVSIESDKALILTGTDKAILTLEDGSQVALEKGESFQSKNAKSDGEQIIYNKGGRNQAEIAFNFLTIPRGGQFHVILSDGTEVWLNSESQLKYPNNFVDGETREVELVYGEAFFVVSPSSNHKGSIFKVMNNAQEIEVLGTEFNIKAYKDDSNVYTTLAEGKVVVNSLNSKKFLKPNQQSILNTLNNEIITISVDVNDVVAWKNGVFCFKEMSLHEIMETLSRWYDVDIIIINEELGNKKFNGVLNKKMTIEKILSIIKSTNKINYNINANDITIQ